MKRITLLCAAVGLASACASAPPQELVDARHEFDRVKSGPAAMYAPAQLRQAEVALDKANYLYTHKNGPEVKDFAYVAQRKAQWADVEGRTECDRRNKVMAQREEMTLQTAQLEKERLARAEAERLAQAALDLSRFGKVREEARGKVLTISGDVLFATGRSALRDGALGKLDKLADALKTIGEQKIVIEGYTDSRGSDKANQELSERRSKAVRDYLVTKGLEPDKLRSIGLGKARPIASNQTSDGRAMNRRVEIVVQGTAAAR